MRCVQDVSALVLTTRVRLLAVASICRFMNTAQPSTGMKGKSVVSSWCCESCMP